MLFYFPLADANTSELRLTNQYKASCQIRLIVASNQLTMAYQHGSAQYLINHFEWLMPSSLLQVNDHVSPCF